MIFAGSPSRVPFLGVVPGSPSRVRFPAFRPTARPDMAKGPAGRNPRGPSSSSAPASGQRRCLGAAPGGCAAGLSSAVQGRVEYTALHGLAGSKWSFLRIVLDERGPRNRLTQPLCIFAISAGRPRASPRPAVPLGDRAAVPCRPVTFPERGPTTHGTIRTSHRSSEPRVVLTGPPLAGADTGTNDTGRGTVTRRTGERPPELRCDPGTIPGASWRVTYPACPAPRCSG